MPNLINYNSKLLTAINSVSAGTNTSVTIYYRDDSKTHGQDVLNALGQWQQFFNTLYHSSRTNNKSGDLLLHFEPETATNKADIIFNVPADYTPSTEPSSKMALSYVINQVGLFFGYKQTKLNTPMNPVQVAGNYIFLSGVRLLKGGAIEGNGLITYIKLIQDTYALYGNPNIKNPIVYGCTKSSAINYISNATVDDGSCIFHAESSTELKLTMRDNVLNSSRNLGAFVEDASNKIQMNFNTEYFISQDSFYGPFPYQESVGSLQLPGLPALSDFGYQDVNDFLATATSSIFTNGSGDVLYTFIATKSRAFIFDRLSNHIIQVGTNQLPFFDYSGSTDLAEYNTQDINTSVYTFGDISISGFAHVIDKGYILIHYLNSKLNNINHLGELIVDCKDDGPYGSSLGNSLGLTIIKADLFGHTMNGINKPFTWDNLTLGQLGITNENTDNPRKLSIYGSYYSDQLVTVAGNENNEKGYYRSNLIYLSNSFSQTVITEENEFTVRGVRYDKFLHFDVYSSNYLIHTIVSRDGQSAGDLSNGTPLNTGNAEYCEPFIFDNRTNKYLYNRKLTVGSFNDEEPSLLYTRLKGFSFDGDYNFYKTINREYNFTSSEFSEGDVELPWTLSYRPGGDEINSQVPVIRGNRRRKLTSDYSSHFNSALAEHSPSNTGSIEEYSTGVFLTALGTAHGFILMFVSAEGIFIPPGDGGIELHLPGGPSENSNFGLGVMGDSWDLFSSYKGLKPISACFTRHDNFLIAIVEGADVSDRYLMIYDVSNIQFRDTSQSTVPNILMNSIVIPNPLSSILTKVELDNYDNIFIFGEEGENEYLKISNADYNFNIRAAVLEPEVAEVLGAGKTLTPSLTNSSSIYTHIKHNLYSNSEGLTTGALTLGESFLTKGYGLDIYNNDYPVVYNLKDNKLVENTNIVLEDLYIYPKHPYSGVMNLYNSEVPTLFDSNGNLLLFAAPNLENKIIDGGIALNEGIVSRFGNFLFNEEFTGAIGGRNIANGFLNYSRGPNSSSEYDNLLTHTIDGLYYRGDRYARYSYPIHQSFFMPDAREVGVIYFFTTDTCWLSSATETAVSGGMSGRILKIKFDRSSDQDISPSNLTEGEIIGDMIYSMWHNLLFPVTSNSYFNTNVVPKSFKQNNYNSHAATKMYKWPLDNYHYDTNTKTYGDAPLDNARINIINDVRGQWLVYMNNPNANVTVLNSSIGYAKIGLHWVDNQFTTSQITHWDKIVNPFQGNSAYPYAIHDMPFSTTSSESTADEDQRSDRVPHLLNFSKSTFIDLSAALSETNGWKEEYNYASAIDYPMIGGNYGLGFSRPSGFRQPLLNDMTIYKQSDLEHIALNFTHNKIGIPLRESSFKTFIYGNFVCIGRFDNDEGSIVIDLTIPIEKVISEYIYSMSGIGNDNSSVYDPAKDNYYFGESAPYSAEPFNSDGSFIGRMYNYNIDYLKDNYDELLGDQSYEGIPYNMWPGDKEDIKAHLENLKVQNEVNYYPFTIKDMCFSTDASVLYILISYNGDIAEINGSLEGAGQSQAELNPDFQNQGFGDRIYKIGINRDESNIAKDYNIKEVQPFAGYSNVPSDFDLEFYQANAGKAMPYHNFTSRSPHQDITKLYRGHDGFIYIGISSREQEDHYNVTRGRILAQNNYSSSQYALYINKTIDGNTQNNSFSNTSQDSQFSFASLNTGQRVREDHFTYINEVVDESQMQFAQSACLNPAACNFNPTSMVWDFASQSMVEVPNEWCVVNGVFGGCCNLPVGDCPCDGIWPLYPDGPCGNEHGACSSNSTHWDEYQQYGAQYMNNATEQWILDNLSYLEQNVPDCVMCSDPTALNWETQGGLPSWSHAFDSTNPTVCDYPGCGSNANIPACDYNPQASSTVCTYPTLGYVANLTQINPSSYSCNGITVHNASNWQNYFPSNLIHPNESGGGHETILHCECSGSGGLVPLPGWCGSCGTANTNSSSSSAFPNGAQYYNINGDVISDYQLESCAVQFNQHYGNNTIYPEGPYCNCAGTPKLMTANQVNDYFMSIGGGTAEQGGLVHWFNTVNETVIGNNYNNNLYFCSCDGKTPLDMGNPLNIACQCDNQTFLNGVPHEAYFGPSQVCNCKGQLAWQIAGAQNASMYLCGCDGEIPAGNDQACDCFKNHNKINMYPDVDGNGVGECYDGDPFAGGQLIQNGDTESCTQCYHIVACPEYQGAGTTDYTMPPGWSEQCGDNCNGEIDECGVCEGPGIPEGDCDCFGNQLDCAEVCGGTSTLDQGLSAETYTSDQYVQEEDSDENNLVTDSETSSGAGYIVYISAVDVLPVSYIWGQNDVSTPVQTSPAIGMGELSSINILNDPNVTPLDGTINAAQACDAYSADGTNHGVTTTYTDWFLPSAYELRELQTAKINGYTILNNEPNNWVWSSSNNNRTDVGYAVWFSMYQLDGHLRSSEFHVIPIRTETLNYVPTIGTSMLGGVVFYVEGVLRRNISGERMLVGEAWCCEASTQMTYYYDSDGDGLGDPEVSLILCPDNPITDTAGCVGAGCYVSNNDDPDDECPEGQLDACGVCFGNNEDMDCAGVCFGPALVDECGDCRELGEADPYWNTECMDCAGVANGTAYVDECGICVEGTTGLLPGETKNRCGICNEPEPVHPNCCLETDPNPEYFCDCEGDGLCIPLDQDCTEDLGCGCGNPAPEDYPCPDCQETNADGCCPGEVFDFCLGECVIYPNPSEYVQSIPNPCNPEECIYTTGDPIADAYACTYCNDPTAINYLQNCAGETMPQVAEGNPVFDSGCCQFETYEDPEVDGIVDVIGDLAPNLETAIVALPQDYETAISGYGVPTRALLQNARWVAPNGNLNDGVFTITHTTHNLVGGHIDSNPNSCGHQYHAQSPSVHGPMQMDINWHTVNGPSESTILYNPSGTNKCQVVTEDHAYIHVDNVGYNGDVIFSGLTAAGIREGWYNDIFKAHRHLSNLGELGGHFFGTEVNFEGGGEDNPYCGASPCTDAEGNSMINGVHDCLVCVRDWYVPAATNVLLEDPSTFGDPIQYLPQFSGAIYTYRPYFYFRLDADLPLTTLDPNVLFAAYADQIEKVERFTIELPEFFTDGNFYSPSIVDGIIIIDSTSEDLSEGQNVYYPGECLNGQHRVWGQLNQDYFEHYMNPPSITVYNAMTGEAEMLNQGQRYSENTHVGGLNPDTNQFSDAVEKAYWVYKITPKSNADGTYQEFVIDLNPFLDDTGIGVCVQQTGVTNYGFTSEGDTITDEELLNDIINGNSDTYYADNTLCEYFNCLATQHVCCEDGYTNSISGWGDLYGVFIEDLGVYGTPAECMVCNNTVCDPHEICTDQSSLTWTDVSLIGDDIEWEVNNDLCEYPVVSEGNLRIDVWVNWFDVYEETLSTGETSEDVLNKLEWLIYGTQQNIFLKSPQITSVTPDGNIAFYTVPLTGLPACSWFLPLGVEEATVWQHTILQINSGSVTNPTTHHEIAYGATNTPGGSISIRANGVGGCVLGCVWGGNDLVTERCVHYVEKDVDEFTEFTLEIDTSYVEDNYEAYDCTKVDVINISSNEVIVGQHGFEHNSQAVLSFNIVDTTKIGIKVSNDSCTDDIATHPPIKYTLKDEQGNILTTKTIY